MKKIKLKFLISLIALLSTVSCQQIIDNILENKEKQNYTSPYMGIWVGSFSGDISGSLKIQVYKSGNVEVTKDLNNVTETFYGGLTGYGSFQSAISPNTGFQILGSLTSSGNADGNWKMQSSEGTWHLTKQ